MTTTQTANRLKVQRAPDGVRYEIIDPETLCLYGTFYSREEADKQMQSIETVVKLPPVTGSHKEFVSIDETWSYNRGDILATNTDKPITYLVDRRMIDLDTGVHIYSLRDLSGDNSIMVNGKAVENVGTFVRVNK